MQNLNENMEKNEELLKTTGRKRPSIHMRHGLNMFF